MSVYARRLSRVPSSPEFRTIGSSIIAPDGTQFVPIGANVAYYRYMMPGFTYDSTFSTLGKSAAAIEWGWNTIRIPTRFDDDFDLLDQLVVEYSSKKIVCVIDCHELWRDAADGALGVNSARIDQLDAFWQTMATKYKRNTYVWFNLHNEPPLSGKSWTELHIRHATLIRDCGARNIIVCDAPNGALDRGPEVVDGLFSWEAPMLPAVITAAHGNVALSFHNYGYRWCDEIMERYVTHCLSVAPLIIGEFGYNVIDGQPSSAGSWDKNFLGATTSLNSLHRQNTGILMWISSGGTDSLALKKNNASFWVGGAGANLAGVGPRLWDMGHGKNTIQQTSVNWIANPLAIDTSSTGYASGWNINTGTIQYRTGQNWANRGTTTDVAFDGSAYVSYYRSYEIDYMPTGSYTASCDILAPSAGSVEFDVSWQDSAYKQIGTTTVVTQNINTGRNTVTFSFNKPANAAAIRIVIAPNNYASGTKFAVTNLTTNGAEFFSGVTPDTATSYYCWSSQANVSASVRVAKHVPA